MPFVQVIVKAFLDPLPTEVAIDIPLILSVDAQTKSDLQLLQVDLGFSSMEKTLRYCVNFTLKNKGVKNEQKSALWFMPIPR